MKIEVGNSVSELFKEFWSWKLKESPEFATLADFNVHSDKLESYSLEAFQRRKVACETFLEKAQKLLENVSSDDETMRDNLELFIEEMKSYLDGLEVCGYFFPISWWEGVHVEFSRLVSYTRLETVEDHLMLLQRYRAFSAQVDEIINLMREGIKRKMVYHSASMKRVLNQFEVLQKPHEKSEFYEPFLSLDKFPESDVKRLQKEARTVIEDVFLPAFKRLAQFIENEYLKCLRSSVSASSLPNGKKYYQQCLNFHLSTYMTPEEVHKVGLREVERINQEMREVTKRLGFEMTQEEFRKFLRTDPQFYFNNKEDLMKSYKDIVENKIKPKLLTIFKSVPDTEISIQGMPESLDGGGQAFYSGGAIDGSRPGVFYVNISNLKATPKYEMMTVALHEGLPGHHLQYSHRIKQHGLPDFRKFREDRKYSDAPARFPLHTAYLEGWALYCEYLGYELGLYEDLYSLYGHLSQEVFRACRLVVDTGMHAFGWSRQQAIDFMVKNSAASVEKIEIEVTRYITWPGQACAYKIGELKIREMRKMAEEQLGDKFDVKDFHEVILNNQGSLKFVEKQVNRYISRRKC